MSGTTIYTFAGVSFTRELDSDTFPPWAFPESEYTADAVLGGSQVYLDIGSDTVATLALRASCRSAVDRQTLKNGRNTTGVLANTRGRSNTYTLIKASPIDSMPYTQYLIDLVFVLRPS